MLIRNLLFLLFVVMNIYAQSIEVLVAKKDIAYKNSIKLDDFMVKHVAEVSRVCIPVTKKDLENNDFIARHFIRSGRILCARSVQEDTAQKVLFDFGSLEIERKAKVIHENDQYIKVRLPNGEIQKIFKNGLDQ